MTFLYISALPGLECVEEFFSPSMESENNIRSNFPTRDGCYSCSVMRTKSEPMNP